MADLATSLISVCLQPFCQSAYQCAEQQLKPICGFKREAMWLERRFSEMEGSISNAEEVLLMAILEALLDPKQKEINEPVVRTWFHRLKDVYCDVDDVLDKWNTVDQMSKIERDQASSKVCCIIPLFYFQRLRLNREIALKMKGLNQKLIDFDESVGKRVHSSESIRKAIMELKPETTSSWDLSRLYGRAKEKELLVNKLLSGGQSGVWRGDIIPIVGMGGIGKTALALLAFHDEAVSTSFTARIWVSVPYFFDLDKIAKVIIEKIEGTAPHYVGLDSLLDHVNTSVTGKKFLLVLDDVWSVETRKWVQLRAKLGTCHAGSRILVTTQKDDVAKMMRASDEHVIPLELLPDDDCWSILRPLASETNEVLGGQLYEVRTELMCKCNGLPLIAQALEDSMRFENTNQHLERVLKSEMGLFKSKVFVPFLLNYYDLSSLQKRCFTHCSVFPRNYEIERDDLVALWMSQGYFRSVNNPEEECLSCFKILAGRYLFQDFTKDYSGAIIKCKMHDVVHEFAHFLTKNECFITGITGADEQKRSQGTEEPRHLTLLLKSTEASIPISINSKKNLRTLFVVRTEAASPLSCDLLVKLTCLRTLHMKQCNIGQLPEEIDKLIHLRYLNLSGNSLRELPEAFCNLFNLMTLRLNGCTQLQRLPEGMGKLVNLQNLYVEGCDSLEALPEEISKLASLRTLDMFVVPSPNHLEKGGALKLEDLNKLQLHQRNLHIFRCGNMKTASSQIQSTQGFNIENFTDVKLNFTGSTARRDIGDERTILETLGQNSRFESLEIIGIGGTTVRPRWMASLNCLKRVVISFCRECEHLPPLGKLETLESLQIDNMDRVERVGLEFLGIEDENHGRIASFLRLKELSFNCLSIWRIWDWTVRGSEEGENTSTIMPCLASLQISRCDKLEALPGFLSRMRQLQNLVIQDCQILKLSCRGGGMDWPKISHIQNIQIDGMKIGRNLMEVQGSEPGRHVPTPRTT